MKSKSTVLWLVLAVALAACIWIFDRYFAPVAAPAPVLLPGMNAEAVTEIQIFPAAAREITAVRTNKIWQLQSPFTYPAQAAAIDALLGALEKISPQRLTAAELHGRNSDTEFGFANPQFSLTVAAGDQQWQLRIGNKTAPGDQVFVRVVGLDGVFVADAGWLALLPHTANDWRDTALVDAAGDCDWIVITNGTKAIELRRDATNHLWRLLRPLAARADGPRIAAALQQLRAARAAQFITDDAKADWSGFGLQPAELEVWLGRGTNFFAAVHA